MPGQKAIAKNRQIEVLIKIMGGAATIRKKPLLERIQIGKTIAELTSNEFSAQKLKANYERLMLKKNPVARLYEEMCEALKQEKYEEYLQIRKEYEEEAQKIADIAGFACACTKLASAKLPKNGQKNKCNQSPKLLLCDFKGNGQKN